MFRPLIYKALHDMTKEQLSETVHTLIAFGDSLGEIYYPPEENE